MRSQAAVLIGQLWRQLPVAWRGGRGQFGGGGRGVGGRVAASSLGPGGQGGEVRDGGRPLPPQEASLQHAPLPHPSLRLAPVPLALLGRRLHLPPDVSARAGAVGRLPRRLRALVGLGGRRRRLTGPELHGRGSPLAVLGPEVAERAAGVRGRAQALGGRLGRAVQHPPAQAEVLEVPEEGQRSHR